MRKVLAVFVLIALVVAFYLSFDKSPDKEENKSTNIFSDKTVLDNIMDDYDGFLAQVRKYQESPDQLAEINCMITKLLYSSDRTDEEIEQLFKFQREYFTKDLLDRNPEDIQYQRLLEELKNYKEQNVKIIGYKKVAVGPEEPIEGDRPLYVFNVVYYLNYYSDGGDVYKGYVFEQNTNGLWELKGFGDIEEFPIVNN